MLHSCHYVLEVFSLMGPHAALLAQACKYIDENLAIPTEKLGKEALINSAMTAMSSKVIGAESTFFAQLVVDAVKAVKATGGAGGKPHYPIKAINVLKAHGKSARESRLLDGYALNMGRASQGMVRRVGNARIACLDMSLNKARMHMGVQVLVSDPKELEKIREREADITRERIQKLLDAGANVILTTKGIDDMALKYFVEAGAMACRRVPKEDLRCAVGKR